MIRQLILGYPYLAIKKLIRTTEFLSKLKLEEIQERLLHRILIHASMNVPFYRECLSEKYTNFDVRDIKKSNELLEKFPLIDKNLIRKNLNDFVSKSKIHRLQATTGGSTGQPLVFYLDRFSTRQREKAFMFDQWSRVGYKVGDPIFNVRGRTPPKNKFIVHDRFFNIYYASSFDINESNIDRYLYHMNKIRPQFLHGYPSTIYQLALLFDSMNKKLDFQYKAVFCGSEKLFEFQRNKIESVFNCRVYSWYGHSEYLALGGECEYSKKYHFYPQYGYTELLPTGLKTKDDRKIFELVATGFNNAVMPLIRYRTGDYAILSKSQECTCGRHYLLIDEIIGREQEFVIDKCGLPISATSLIFGQHYKAFEGIESLQINQNKIGEIEIVIVKNENLEDSSLRDMKEKMKSILGVRMTIIFSFSGTIEKSPLGKAKLVNQELDINKYLKQNN